MHGSQPAPLRRRVWDREKFLLATSSGPRARGAPPRDARRGRKPRMVEEVPEATAAERTGMFRTPPAVSLGRTFHESSIPMTAASRDRARRSGFECMATTVTMNPAEDNTIYQGVDPVTVEYFEDDTCGAGRDPAGHAARRETLAQAREEHRPLRDRPALVRSTDLAPRHAENGSLEVNVRPGQGRSRAERRPAHTRCGRYTIGHWWTREALM